MGVRDEPRGNGRGDRRDRDEWRRERERMARGTYGERSWGRDESFGAMGRRTDEEEIDRRHMWSGRGYAPFPPSGDWRNWGPEEVRHDLDRRTDEEEIDRRHMWSMRGEARRPSEWRRRGREEPWRGSFWPGRYGYEPHGEEAGFGGRWEGRGQGYRPGEEERWYGGYGRGGRREGGWRSWEEERRFGRGGRRGHPEEGSWFGRGEREGPDWERGESGRILEERGHGFRGGDRGGYDESEGERYEGGRRMGRGARWEAPRFGRRMAPWERGREEFRYEGGARTRPRTGYGGYGGGPYGGSYGGMGPGVAGRYPPTGETGGVSGAGSLAGGAGLTAGWEPERMGIRESRTAGWDFLEESDRGRPGWEREGPVVRELMTREPKVVGPDSPARDAARLMREEDAGIVPVVSEGKVIGVITDRDLAIRVLAEGRDPNMATCREVMSEDVLVCSPGDRLVDVVRIMGEDNVRRVPVVGRDGRLQGILSMTDVAREAELDYALQEALEQIASRRSFWSRS